MNNGQIPLIHLSKIWICSVKYFYISKSVWGPVTIPPSPQSISLQKKMCHCSEILIDEPVRLCRGSDGGEFNRLIHISWTAYISSSTSVFQPTAWFMEEIWIETKTLANTNAEWLIFKWQIPSRWLYHWSATQFILSYHILPRPICLFHEFTLKLSALYHQLAMYMWL